MQTLEHCTALKSGKPVRKQSAQEMFNTTINWQQDEPLLIFAPLISKQKGEFHTLFADLQRQGFVRVRVDGEIMRLEDCGRLEKYKQHTIELVIDRVTNSKENHPRLFEAIELAIKQANGLVRIEHVETKEAKIYSENFVSDDHQFTITELTPRLFSFNSPIGACPDCNGLGDILTLNLTYCLNLIKQ